MTRTFFHLIFIVSFFILTSCSTDDQTTAPSELEGATANVEAEGGDDENLEEFEDFDVETAQPDVPADDVAADDSDDSFDDIENFNEDMMANELNTGSETPADTTADATEELNPSDELDLETAVIAENPPAAEATPEPTPTPAEPTVFGKADNKITNLEYKSYESGGTVVITAEKPFEYQVREEPQFNQTIIEVSNVDLAQRFKLPYIAKDFDQPTATINAYQDEGSTTATFVIQYKTAVKPSVQMQQNSLMVMSSGAMIAGADVNPTGDVASEVKKLNIEMQDVEIKDLVKLIADEVGFNVIVDEDVAGKTNVKLQNVSWEEGLSTILKSNGVAYERRGQILRVAKVEKLTKELNEVKGKLDAEKAANDASEKKIVKIVPINYADPMTVEKQMAPFLSEKGKATADLSSNALVLYDFETNVARAEQVLRSLDVKPIQVLIEGKIIEANTQFAKEFGINWTSSTSFQMGSRDGSLNSTIRADRDPNTSRGGYIGNLNIGTFDVLGDIAAQLNMLESEQKIKILSSPKVMTVNKNQAIIRQTVQVPLLQTTATQGVIQTTATFQDAVLSLQVTPQVSFNSDMVLDIRVNRDIPGADFNGSRQINKREAQTKVIVKDGQSVVLGGIFSMDEQAIEVGVPWLKDIPILGYLFKTKRREIQKNELVIFLLPRIMDLNNSLKTLEMSRNSDKSTAPEASESFQNDSNETNPDIDSEMETL